MIGNIPEMYGDMAYERLLKEVKHTFNRQFCVDRERACRILLGAAKYNESRIEKFFLNTGGDEGEHEA